MPLVVLYLLCGLLCMMPWREWATFIYYIRNYDGNFEPLLSTPAMYTGHDPSYPLLLHLTKPLSFLSPLLPHSSITSFLYSLNFLDINTPLGGWLKILASWVWAPVPPLNNTRWVDSASHPSEVSKMSTSLLETGAMPQQHSRTSRNYATSSHRWHTKHQ